MAAGFSKLNICVLGLWHLGTVTAACLSSVGHTTIGLDFDSETVMQLREGCPPTYEAGVKELIETGLREGTLSFTTDIRQAVAGIDLLWVSYDTPVDSEDRADVGFVFDGIEGVLPFLDSRVQILISSQLPVGSTRLLEARQARMGNSELVFSYSPENLRLGQAVSSFLQPSRVVVGVRRESHRPLLQSLFSTFTQRIEWMSVESAEMTKHAVNAFLATSVSFINELAVICERVGADAKEVERGLRTEPRIGPRAYLSPGGAFTGGTLARDVAFLVSLSEDHEVSACLFRAVRASNEDHRKWTHRKLVSILGDLKGRTIAIWGLTYKAGTNTLRRSGSIELCEWLSDNGAVVQAHDPGITKLPPGLSEKINLCETPLQALREAAALVIATEWPDYKAFDAGAITSCMQSAIVLDPSRFLSLQLESNPAIRYITVGKG